MLWRAERDVLRQAVDTVRPAVGRAHIPVLSGIRLDVDEHGTLTATGSDLDLTIITTAKGATVTPGTIVVPARLLSSWLGKAPSGAIELEHDTSAGTVTFTGQGASLTLHALNTDEWPRIQQPEGAPVILDDPAWARIRTILPFASTDDSRPALCMIQLTAEGAWATDSFRLAWAQVDVPAEANLPAETLRLIAKAVPDGALSMTVDDRTARFERDGTAWTCRLNAAEPPNCARLIPGEDPPCSITFDLAAFTDALGRHVLLSDPKNVTPAKLTVTGEQMGVTSRAQDVGETADLVDCATTGDVPVVAFNPHYLGSVLAAHDLDRPTLSGFDGLKPWVAKSEGLLTLIMPVRVA